MGSFQRRFVAIINMCRISASDGIELELLPDKLIECDRACIFTCVSAQAARFTAIMHLCRDFDK